MPSISPVTACEATGGVIGADATTCSGTLISTAWGGSVGTAVVTTGFLLTLGLVQQSGMLLLLHDLDRTSAQTIHL